MPTCLGIGFGAGFDGNLLVSDPSGLPPGAIAYADFAAGTYYYGGNTLSDFLVEDATNWGAFDPASLVPGEGLPSEQSPILAPGLVSTLAADGATFVAAFFFAPNGNIQIDVTDFPDYTAEYVVLLDTFSTSGIGSGGTLHLDLVVDGGSNTSMTTGEHKLAFTFLPSGDVAVSIDGYAVRAASNEAAGPPSINAMGLAIGASLSGSNYFRSLVIYPPKANAELPALSAL